jgi:hypothetical protein
MFLISRPNVALIRRRVDSMGSAHKNHVSWIKFAHDIAKPRMSGFVVGSGNVKFLL